MSPPTRMWMPQQEFDPLKGEYMNALNNPQPMLHHHFATTSSGRVLRLPVSDNGLDKMWNPNFFDDAMVMNVHPDPTLTGTSTGFFPQMLSQMYAPLEPQFGPGRI